MTEVAEANAYAPAEDLEPGAEGFLEYREGVPVVERRPGERRVRPVRAGPRVASAARPAPRPDPRRPDRRRPPRVAPSVWVLTALLVLVIALAWIR